MQRRREAERHYPKPADRNPPLPGSGGGVRELLSRTRAGNNNLANSSFWGRVPRDGRPDPDRRSDHCLHTAARAAGGPAPPMGCISFPPSLSRPRGQRAGPARVPLCVGARQRAVLRQSLRQHGPGAETLTRRAVMPQSIPRRRPQRGRQEAKWRGPSPAASFCSDYPAMKIIFKMLS